MQKNTLLQQRVASALVGVRQYKLSLIELLASGMVAHLNHLPDAASAWAQLEADERGGPLYGETLLSTFSDLIKPKGLFAWFGARGELSEQVINSVAQVIRSAGLADQLYVDDMVLPAVGSAFRAAIDRLKKAPLDVFQLEAGHVKSEELDGVIASLQKNSWAGFWLGGTNLIHTLSHTEKQLISLSDTLASKNMKIDRDSRSVMLDDRRYQREQWSSQYDDELFTYWLWFYLFEDSGMAYGEEYEEGYVTDDAELIMGPDDDATRRSAAQANEGEFGGNDAAGTDGISPGASEVSVASAAAAAATVGAAVAVDAALDHQNLGSFS